MICKYHLLLSMLLIFVLMSEKSYAAKDNDATSFYIKKNNEAESQFQYNQYEDLISGGAAFVIGNVGHLLSDSSFLKLSYAAIQTIGIINIGQGIYKIKLSNADVSFYRMLTDKKTKTYTKEEIAEHLLEISAKESRAKRLSIFYSSMLLSTQYLINVTVYDSAEKIKNIYYFLGGINLIIASYMALYKSDSEKYFFGDNIDLSPFVYQQDRSNLSYGAIVSYHF